MTDLLFRVGSNAMSQVSVYTDSDATRSAYGLPDYRRFMSFHYVLTLHRLGRG